MASYQELGLSIIEIDVQDQYVTHVGRMEDAGYGNVRIVHCIKRSGMLLPVVGLIVPAAALIHASVVVRDFALEIFNGGDMRAH